MVIDFRLERVLTDYNKYLSRATHKGGLFFFFFFFWEKEIVDGNDLIYLH